MSTVNLLPDDYIRQRQQRRGNFLCLALLVVVIAGVLCATALSKRSAAHTQTIRDRVNADYAEAAKLIDQMHELEATKDRMLRKAELTASLVERVPRSTLLAVVANALPEGASLKSLDLQTQRIIKRAENTRTTGSRLTTESRNTSSTPAKTRVSIEITGLAGTDVQVAKFIANLARNPLTASVDLVYSEEKKIEDIVLREFQIRTILKGKADAIELAQPTERAVPGRENTENGEAL